MGSCLRSNRHRSRLRASAWLLVLAMLWGILAPRLGWAVAPADSHWVEICTGHGIQAVLVGDDGAVDNGTGGQASAADECPWCLSHFKAAPPPRDAGQMAQGAANDCVLAATGAACAPSGPAWRPALPRAPPPLTTSA